MSQVGLKKARSHLSILPGRRCTQFHYQFCDKTDIDSYKVIYHLCNGGKNLVKSDFTRPEIKQKPFGKLLSQLF